MSTFRRRNSVCADIASKGLDCTQEFYERLGGMAYLVLCRGKQEESKVSVSALELMSTKLYHCLRLVLAPIFFGSLLAPATAYVFDAKNSLVAGAMVMSVRFKRG